MPRNIIRNIRTSHERIIDVYSCKADENFVKDGVYLDVETNGGHKVITFLVEPELDELLVALIEAKLRLAGLGWQRR